MIFRTIISFLLLLAVSGCGTTLNGVTLSDGRLKQAKRIVVVALADNIVTYQRAGFNGEFRTMDMPLLDLDNFYAQRFADAMSSTLGVQATAYQGPRHDTLKRNIYAARPLLRRDRFDWKATEQDLRAVAAETDADLIAVILREGFNDELSPVQAPVAGFGFTSGRGLCAAFAHLTVLIVDATQIEPIAGANVFRRDADGKVVPNRRGLPGELCKKGKGATELSPEQFQILRQTLLTIIDSNTIEQTTKRLLKYE